MEQSDCFQVENPRKWYLQRHSVPHHKPGKVRRVLNGAAKIHAQILNATLWTGPDLLQSLIHVLQFRHHQYAVSADIEGMFLQVGVIPTVQPNLNFLCRKDPATNVAVFHYIKHIFGAKDSPTCANYALQRTASHKATKYPAATRSVQESFHRDDYLKSSRTIQKAKQKAQNLECLLRLGGFNLIKFVSNVHVVVALNRNKKIICVKVIASDNETSHVLDLKWNHQSDTLVVSWGTGGEQKSLTTQRTVLSLVSAVFDPIGLVDPSTVRARLLLKDIWRLSGQKWDHELPEGIVQQFFEWSKNFPPLWSQGAISNMKFIVQSCTCMVTARKLSLVQSLFSKKKLKLIKQRSRTSLCDWWSTRCTYESADDSDAGVASGYAGFAK